MEVKFNYTVNEIENRIICDTNIWYYIASKQISVEKNFLTATAFSIEELATSPSQVKNVKFYQEVIKTIKEYSSPIIALNPFDFVLSNHDNTFPINEKYFEQILVYFSKILTHEIPEDFKLSDEVKKDILEKIKIERAGKNEFAEYGTELAHRIQGQLNTGYKQKQHKVEDAYEINKATIALFLKEYAKKKGYTINFKNFDWNQIELFMKVTGRYFNELETTTTMKMQPNDIVDWLNLMYVTPEDKYITCEKKWRRYITEDEKINDYLYKGIICPQ